MASKYNTVLGPYLAQDAVILQFGPGILGALLAMIFFGFALSAGTEYFTSNRFRSDSWKLKCLVLTVSVLAVTESSLHAWLFYNIGTETQRSLESMFNATFLDNFSSIPVGLEGALVQGYLAMRASSLFNTKTLKYAFLLVASAPIFCGFFGSMTYGAVSYLDTAGKISSALPLTYPNTLEMWLLRAALADIVVTISLIVNLRSRMKGFRASTDKMLKQLIYLAIESASYTAIFALVPAVLVLALSETSSYVSVYTAFPAPLSALYLLSLFKNLNARAAIRASGAQTTDQYNIRSAYSNNNSSASHLRKRSQLQSANKVGVISVGGKDYLDEEAGRIHGHPLVINYEFSQERYEEDGESEKVQSPVTRFGKGFA